MGDVSNRTIVALAVVLLLIAAVVIFNVSKLSREGAGDLISGAASSSSGEINLSITSTTSLTNQVAQMNFGSGRVNASCSYCIMSSNNTNVSIYGNGSIFHNGDGSALCCVGFTRVGKTGFLLENTGNVNISIGYTCSGNCTHATFIGGNLASVMGGIDVRVTNQVTALQSGESGVTDNAASCVGGGAATRDTGWNITNSSGYLYGFTQNGSSPASGTVYTTLSSLGHWLCGNSTSYPLSFINTNDAAVVDLNITVPHDAPGTGLLKAFTLTFNGTSAG